MHPKASERLSLIQNLTTRLESLSPSDKEYGKIAKELASHDEFVSIHNQYQKTEDAISEYSEWLKSEDEDLKLLAQEELPSLKKNLEDLYEQVLVFMIPQDPMKDKNALVEIRAGAGGDEAALFASDLFLMYSRYSEKRNWKIEVLSSNEAGVGGYKEIVFTVSGKGVYGTLKLESGVHRVQRVPVTESGGRIHTSTASVAVLPETDKTDMSIDEKDLKIDVYRASGAGGQHVNKTESAVRITHLPSGLVVTCQDGRSQIQNKASAMLVLQSRLYDIEEQKRQASESEQRKAQIGSGDRSEKIRTYNFQENRVTDHRIKLTLHKLDMILTGDLEELLSHLEQSQNSKLLEFLQ